MFPWTRKIKPLFFPLLEALRNFRGSVRDAGFYYGYLKVLVQCSRSRAVIMQPVLPFAPVLLPHYVLNHGDWPTCQSGAKGIQSVKLKWQQKAASVALQSQNCCCTIHACFYYYYFLQQSISPVTIKAFWDVIIPETTQESLKAGTD